MKLSTFTVLSVSENIGLPAWNVNKIHLLVTHLSFVDGDERYLTNDVILISISSKLRLEKLEKHQIHLEN